MIEELFTVQQYRAALAEREATIEQLRRQRDEQSQFWAADIAALQEARARVEQLRRELDAMRRAAGDLADENGHITTELLHTQLELNAARAQIEKLWLSLKRNGYNANM